ncbi:MAG: serine/threonine-protein kinase, partial [Acidobacteriota bacterium]
MMGEGSWRHVRQVFHRAVERPESERGPLLDELCGDDDDLRAEVEDLLAAEASPLPWLERPALVEAWHRLDSAEAEDQLAGAQLGPYRLEQELGRGGMGTVYLASRADGQYRQRVAVKVIRGGMGADAARRFRDERQILADLTHPNIAHLLDGGVTADGDPFLVMEYIDGEAIDVYCDRHRLGVRQRIELFLRVCSALRHAHRHLVVHCDLKPGNILVTPEGEPKLLDFGVARWLAAESAGRGDQPAARRSEPDGPRWLTLGYASPEQVRGQPPVMASDVYSLGVLLHVLLVGQGPEKRQASRRADRRHDDVEARDVEARGVEARGVDRRHGPRRHGPRRH